jgi:phosphoribosylanthranilate isomerase
MTLTIKICGLSTPETLDSAISAGADMVGLNFFPKSPRFIDLTVAKNLAGRARRRAEIVALGVDMDDERLAAIVDAVHPDWLQLHGAESPERAAEIGERFATKVMKVLPVGEKSDLAAAARYRSAAAGLLLDARPPKGATRPGGNAAVFDWRLLEGFTPGLPWLLAGGLDAGNVAEALRISNAPGVDVSSGVESAPGVKDVGLIRSFIAAARAARRQPERIA